MEFVVIVFIIFSKVKNIILINYFSIVFWSDVLFTPYYKIDMLLLYDDALELEQIIQMVGEVHES